MCKDDYLSMCFVLNEGELFSSEKRNGVRNKHFSMKTKRFHPSPATLCLILLVLGAVLVRLTLLSASWPVTTSDEAVIDLMARHIAYQGEHPIFYYGQGYMGTIQAYLGAGLMLLFGSSVFTVRLGTLLLFALFLVGMYFLVKRVYTQRFALFTVGLLSIGTEAVIQTPLLAIGGYAETLLFSVLIFLFVLYLASFSSSEKFVYKKNKQRLIVYGLLGFLYGVSFWSDQLIIPAIAVSTLLLLCWCRREVLGLAGVVLIIGLLLGALPLILYNVHAPPGRDTWHDLLLTTTRYGEENRPVSLWQQFVQAILVGLPTMTGAAPLCSLQEPYYAVRVISDLFPCPYPWLHILIQGGWSLGMLALWVLAVACSVTFLRQRRAVHSVGIESQGLEILKQYMRLMLLSSALLWFLLYAASFSAAKYPSSGSRYLECLLVTTPALLWPLWAVAGRFLVMWKREDRWKALGSGVVLLYILATALCGTFTTFRQIPIAQSQEAQYTVLVNELQKRGITRFYTDYWTCNILIFRSNEHLLCGSMKEHLGLGVNRYPAYILAVQATRHPAYVFPLSSPQAHAMAHGVRKIDSHYVRTVLGQYIIYYYHRSATSR